MKITNDRRTIPSFAKPVYDLWNRTGRTLVIDRDSYEFTSRVNQLAYLRDCRVNVGRVGVGHGLHHDGRIAADDQCAAHGDGNAAAADDVGGSCGHVLRAVKKSGGWERRYLRGPGHGGQAPNQFS